MGVFMSVVSFFFECFSIYIICVLEFSLVRQVCT